MHRYPFFTLDSPNNPFRFRNDDRCVCGERGNVAHDFLDCPEIRHLHRGYREKVGDASNSVGEGERGKRDPTSASEDDGGCPGLCGSITTIQSRAH